MADLPKRAGGRRPLEKTGSFSAEVHVRLAARDYDAIYRHAVRREESVPSVIRRGLRRLLKDERGGSF